MPSAAAYQTVARYQKNIIKGYAPNIDRLFPGIEPFYHGKFIPGTTYWGTTSAVLTKFTVAGLPGTGDGNDRKLCRQTLQLRFYKTPNHLKLPMLSNG